MAVGSARNGLDPWYTSDWLQVAMGSSHESGRSSASANAVPLATGTFGNRIHSRITGDPATNIATTDNPAKRDIGLNLFANPTAVYQPSAPTLVNHMTSVNFSGNPRRMPGRNADRDIAWNLQWTERVSTTLSTQSPQSFGVPGTQPNQPRVPELGLHTDFS